MYKKISTLTFGFTLFFVAVFILPTTFFSNCSACSGKKITAEGKVSLVGNEPFTRLILESKDGVYILEGKVAVQGELLKSQNKKIRVQGKFIKDSKEIVGSKGTIRVKSFIVL